jgi:hypothetical protein
VNGSPSDISLGGFVDLTIKNDVAEELHLTAHMMHALDVMAEMGGQIRWSWGNVQAQTREMMTQLIGYELVREHGLLEGACSLRLTDKGRNVLSIHRQRKIVASEVKPIG